LLKNYTHFTKPCQTKISSFFPFQIHEPPPTYNELPTTNCKPCLLKNYILSINSLQKLKKTLKMHFQQSNRREWVHKKLVAVGLTAAGNLLFIRYALPTRFPTPRHRRGDLPQPRPRPSASNNRPATNLQPRPRRGIRRQPRPRQPTDAYDSHYQPPTPTTRPLSPTRTLLLTFLSNKNNPSPISAVDFFYPICPLYQHPIFTLSHFPHLLYFNI